MKLSVENVKVREGFVREFFSKTPDATGAAANEALAKAFPFPDGSPGRKMRAQRLYALREEARKGTAEVAVVAPAPTPAAPAQ